MASISPRVISQPTALHIWDHAVTMFKAYDWILSTDWFMILAKDLESHPLLAQRCYINEGLIRARLGEYDFADEAFRMAVSMDKNSVILWCAMAELHFTKEQWQSAIACFNNALLILTKGHVDDEELAFGWYPSAQELEHNLDILHKIEERPWGIWRIPADLLFHPPKALSDHGSTTPSPTSDRSQPQEPSVGTAQVRHKRSPLVAPRIDKELPALPTSTPRLETIDEGVPFPALTYSSSVPLTTSPCVRVTGRRPRHATISSMAEGRQRIQAEHADITPPQPITQKRTSRLVTFAEHIRSVAQLRKPAVKLQAREARVHPESYHELSNFFKQTGPSEDGHITVDRKYAANLLKNAEKMSLSSRHSSTPSEAPTIDNMNRDDDLEPDRISTTSTQIFKM